MSLPSDEMAKAIRALLPDGPIWNQKPDGFFEKLIDGIGENYQSVFEFMCTLAQLQDPDTTTLLKDLEKEFGILTNTNLTDAQRRELLKGIKYATPKGGSASDLQDYLQAAGFDLIVTPNDPMVDPNDVLQYYFQMMAGGYNAYAGYYNVPGIIEAFAGYRFGELIVNGPIAVENVPAYLMQANGSYAYARHGKAYAGYFISLKKILAQYEVPDNADDGWPFIFFVGGTSHLDDVPPWIESRQVLEIRRTELRKLILKHKPIRSWCVLVVEYI